MEMKITTKEVYGRPLNYIVDDKQAEAVRKLTGRKSVTPDDLEALKELGFDIKNR